MEYQFHFSIPQGATIEAAELRVDAAGSGAKSDAKVSVRLHGADCFVDSATIDDVDLETTYTFNLSSCVSPMSVADLNAGMLSVQVDVLNDSYVSLEHLEVTVTYVSPPT